MRLTKRYENGTYGIADKLPCGENSHDFKQLLINNLGWYEERDLAQSAIETTERPSAAAAVEDLTEDTHCRICGDKTDKSTVHVHISDALKQQKSKVILTEEELKERNRLLVLENDELLAENMKYKKGLFDAYDFIFTELAIPKHYREKFYRILLIDCNLDPNIRKLEEIIHE